jgi:hypothetical protein
MGHGRWCIKPHLIKDRPLGKYIEERGYETLQMIEEVCTQGRRTESNNPQTLYAKFKRHIFDMVKKREKATVPKIIQEIHRHESEIDAINNDLTLTQEEKLSKSEGLTLKLLDLKRKEHLKRRNVIIFPVAFGIAVLY